MPSESAQRQAAADSFKQSLGRLLWVFFFVALTDLLVVSLFTGKLRIWFPQWVDPNWAHNPDAWVVYSQSYFAGILLIPVLLSALDRAFVRNLSGSLRLVFWFGGLGAFGFILWWKGGLMRAHDKELEALAFALLTALLYGMVLGAHRLPEWSARISSQALLRGLLVGLTVFFLVMAVLDPVLQVAVQKLPWSPGLIIEMVFFIPAGLLTGWLAMRLRRANDSSASAQAAS